MFVNGEIKRRTDPIIMIIDPSYIDFVRP